MKNKLIQALLTGLVFLLLTGCSSWAPEDFYQLPKAPEDYKNLMSQIAQTKRELAATHSTTVEDLAPSSGDNTSTVQQLDMDGDGTLETAVTFFRLVGAEQPLHIYFYTLQEDESYRVTSVIRGDGSAIYAIYYTDLDGQVNKFTGRQDKEVVVNWQMGTDANYLGAYALNGPEASNLLLTTYQSYRLVDIDRDSRMELAVGRIDLQNQINTVEIYAWDPSGLASVWQAPLSTGLTAIRTMRANLLSDQVPALYISGDLADGSRATEVVALRGEELVNLSLDSETGVSREVVNVYKDVAVSDVNEDYILELAHPHALPAHLNNGSFWLIDWTQYALEGEPRQVTTTFHNITDGWYLHIPEGWRDKLTIYRNDSISGQRAVIFALWQGEGAEPVPFLSVYKLTGANRAIRATSGNRFILAEDTSTIYAATFYDAWDCGLDKEALIARFRLILSSWSGD